MAGPLDVVVVEPWYGGSHAAWADGLRRHSRHHVELLTLPDRHWRWRLRGAALTVAAALDARVARRGRPDVVLVSDMVDLAALRGLARDALAGVPVALYLHENQVVWPDGPARRAGDPSAWVTWTSMAAADVVLLATRHHRDVLLSALADLLAAVPDHAHTGHLDAVAARCEVVPVGVELDGLLDGERKGSEVTGEAPLVVWNQRWDDDRQPDRLVRILGHLAAEGVPFRVALAGPDAWADRPLRQQARALLGDRLVHDGWCPPQDYAALLLRSDVVVSVTRHEYFGIAVVEAVAAGCVPVLPARLSYPELVPAAAHDCCLYRRAPAAHLRQLLTDLPTVRADPAVASLRTAMRRWSWPEVIGAYDDRLAALVATGR